MFVYVIRAHIHCHELRWIMATFVQFKWPDSSHLNGSTILCAVPQPWSDEVYTVIFQPTWAANYTRYHDISMDNGTPNGLPHLYGVFFEVRLFMHRHGHESMAIEPKAG